MQKKEANFSIVFRHWLLAHPFHTATFEMKQTAKDSIPFSCLEPQQCDYAEAIRHSKKGVLMRLQGVNGEPDFVYYKQEPAYIVIKFPGQFSIISAEAFLIEKKRSTRKSLTCARASELSTITVKLK